MIYSAISRRAGDYFQLSFLEVQQEIIEEYFKSSASKHFRPINHDKRNALYVTITAQAENMLDYTSTVGLVVRSR